MSSTPLNEFNVVTKDSSRVDLLFGYCYPSTYRAGMTGLALHILYATLNSRIDTSCERYFRFDTASPFQSIESSRPLKENHIIGFSLTYEEDILHLVQMLELGGVPAIANQRRENDPIVIVGGPVVTANPEPFVDFVDAFVIGEGDLIVHEIVDVVKKGNTRNEAILELNKLIGLYVPTLPKPHVGRNIISDLDSLPYPTTQIIPDVPEGSLLEPVFGKSFLLEVTRGCGHSCKFCLIGHICRPRRSRSLKRLKEIINHGRKDTPTNKISMIGSSLGDLDELEELVCWTVNQGLEVSVPSLRADSVSKPLLDCLVKSGQRTLTIAPESGSTRMRRRMGKGLDDTDIENAIDVAKQAGYSSLKLYFIIGLPEETDEDVQATVEMITKFGRTSGLKVTASVNPYIPKAQTRWEREPQPSIDEIRRKIQLVEKGVKKASKVTVETLDPRRARIQAALSLGDRTLGPVILKASKYGGFGGWRRAERETKIPLFSIANEAERLKGELPWSFLRE